jgi:diaminopimelate epimerase
MNITKMHGAGNDFVILNNMDGQLSQSSLPALAKALCARHTGVGADGMMVVSPPEKGGDFGMLFYNADGSLGEMCGNGARCICRYGFEHGLAGERQRVETTAGPVLGERLDKSRYRVRLNDPSVVDLHRQAEVGGSVYDCAYLELGDPGIPHAVLLLPDWERMSRDALRSLGRALRCAPVFPRGANVSFVRLTGPGAARAVTYERGVEDFTLACGTGCGSIAAALTLLGLVSGPEVSVAMPGGLLSVRLTRRADSVGDILLTGPTCLVFEGEASGELLEETCRIF